MSFVGRKRSLLDTPSRGPGFLVAGVGRARTLAQLKTMLDANPSADVTLLGDYNAERDGVFASAPLATTAAYTGTFDGQFYKFRGFRLTDTSAVPSRDIGIFAQIGDNSGAGKIKNLTIGGTIRQTAWERETIDGQNRFLLGVTVGGLCAFNRGTIEYVRTEMKVFGSGSGGQFAGLVGRNLEWTDKTITGITRAANGVMTIANHGMQTGARLYLKDIVGMTELNGQTVTIARIDANTFSIGVNTTGYGAYVSGGVALGAGTVRFCTAAGAVVLNSFAYNCYHSPLVGSNHGLLEHNRTLASCVSIAAGGYNLTPVLADYYDTGAVFTGSITSNVMTVSSIARGSIINGQYVYAPNSIPGTIVTASQTVTGQLTGTPGGVGTYSVSAGNNVTSRDLFMSPKAPGTSKTTGSWHGGLCGDNGLPTIGSSPTALVRFCINEANLLNSNNTNSANYTGGIIGYQGDGRTEDCLNLSTRLTGANSVGGILGCGAISTNALRRCISLSDILSQRDVDGDYGSNLGTIFGQTYGIVEDVTGYGNVSGGGVLGGVGGLVRGSAVITGFVGFGNVSGLVNLDGTTGANVGGLFGQTLSGCVIDQGFCTGISTGFLRVGAAIGNVQAGSTLTNVRWDVDSTGSATGIGSGTSAGVTAISDASLIAAIPGGFDGRWSRSSSHSSFYPYINTLPLGDLPGGVLPAPTINLNPPLSASFVGFGTSVDSSTISLPSGLQAGDYCILFDFSQNVITSAPSLVTPSGFSNVLSQTSAATHGTRAALGIKILAGTETALTGITAGARGALKAAAVFRPSNPAVGDVWTRLNARNVVNGAASGVANQTVGAGTPPCLFFAASVTEGGTNHDPLISTGDNESIEIASAITPALKARISFRINNAGSAAVTLNADTTNGVCIAGMNVSVS
ncbi:ubiquitin-activating E1 FCCH domain-containing protein [Reyranella sp.]|uniref:ubiquitin-activating E1 FCCH domain-containing protein n=1 Tax=Reyranella sp. TaxID=1929291 RepID=UPI003C7AE154